MQLTECDFCERFFGCTYKKQEGVNMPDHYNIKQVIVLRTDLRDTEGRKIPRGKQAAMCAHASLKVFFDRMEMECYLINKGIEHQIWKTFWTPNMIAWKNKDFAKIILGCDSLGELMGLVDDAQKIGIPYAVIEDNGTTCFGGESTVTCAAFGPAASGVLNKITGHLKLLV
jgi:peptidyl-tRNA hydrolase